MRDRLELAYRLVVIAVGLSVCGFAVVNIPPHLHYLLPKIYPMRTTT